MINLGVWDVPPRQFDVICGILKPRTVLLHESNLCNFLSQGFGNVTFFCIIQNITVQQNMISKTMP